MSAWQQLRAQSLRRWHTLSPREQRVFAVLSMLLCLVVFWAIAMAPALDTLRDSDKRRQHIGLQHAQMLAWQAQAKALQAATPVSHSDALRTLQSLSPSPQIQLQVQGHRVAAQLKAVPAPTLANWLTQVRQQAHTLPVEVHLTLAQPVNTATAHVPAWDGSMVLVLPNRGTAP